MRSIRSIYTVIETATLIVTLCFVFILLTLLREHVSEGYIRALTADISKIDISIEGFVKNNILTFQEHLILKDRDAALRVLSNFGDIYHVSDQLIIDRIIKKDRGSQIFPGYDAGSSGLGAFLKGIYGKEYAYSTMQRSPENEQLSFYIAVRDGSGHLVGRIGLDRLLNNLSRMAEYNRSIIMIATRDGYVLSSSERDLPVSVLPQRAKTELEIAGKNYLLSRVPSTVFENDIVMLAPLSQVYGILTSMTKYYVFFTIFVVLAFVLKILLQTKLFIRPLSDFAVMLQQWDVQKSDKMVPKAFLSYEEIGILYRLFLEKSSEIQEAMEEIRRNEQEIDRIRLYLKNIIDSMPSMLISVNEEDIIHEWNQAAAHFTGIPPSEAIGKRIWEVMPILRKYEDEYREAFQLHKGKQLGTEIFNSDTDHYISISLFPLVQDVNKEMAIRLDDVTELEKTEQQLRQAQKMEIIGTLVGGLAHDFNNILAGIVGTLSLMKFHLQHPGELQRYKLDDYIATMEKSGQRATDLIKQMLILSRKQDLVFEPVDLNTVLMNVVKICGNTFDRRIEISAQLRDEKAMVNADPAQMEQVFLNLFINAMHAMTTMNKGEERHGGILNLAIHQTATDECFAMAHPEARPDSDYWKVSVQDTGIGMDVKTVVKIFDPFFSTKEKGKGSGLGLTMVYNIVHQHGGFIDVYSEPGKGSTFNIFLPVLKGAPDMAAAAEESLPPSGKGMILIIDDEEHIRFIAREMLGHCGYTTLTAGDGEEGVALYRAHMSEIRLVILDINMPKLSGVETFTKLKEIDSGVTVMVASGFTQNGQAETLMRMGARRFLQKPFTLASLAQAVADLLKA
jgi:PAS domain S-box-containing protein